MTFNEKQELEDLQSQALTVMEALTKLSSAALRSKDRKMTKPASDLYYATNRAWHEIDNQVTAIGDLVRKLRP